ATGPARILEDDHPGRMASRAAAHRQDPAATELEKLLLVEHGDLEPELLAERGRLGGEPLGGGRVGRKVRDVAGPDDDVVQGRLVGGDLLQRRLVPGELLPEVDARLFKAAVTRGLVLQELVVAENGAVRERGDRRLAAHVVGDEGAQSVRDRARSLSLEAPNDLGGRPSDRVGGELAARAEPDERDATLAVGPVKDRELLALPLDLLPRPRRLDDAPGGVVLLLQRPRERVVLLGAFEYAARRHVRLGRQAVAAVDLDLHGPSVGRGLE